MAFSNGLTPAEDERLNLLVEEMGEALQVIGKIGRHGYESYHPKDPDTTNRMLLEKELGHVCLAIHMMLKKGDLCETEINKQRLLKAESIGQWLHHQG